MERIKRDYRVDFCRGMALLVIFWDHVVFMTRGQSLIFRLTPEHWGFSDAAELFVFLSGFVFGIVYGRVLDSDGYIACQRKAFHRVGQIYFANSVALLSTMGIVSFFVYVVGTSPGYLNEFFDAPVEMLLRGAALNYLPWNFGILPLYMVILAAMPPLLVLMRRNVTAGLAVSLAVYACALFIPALNLPRYNGVNGQWSFNPFAWQLLFAIAAAMGMGALDCSQVPRNRYLLALAIAIIAVAPALRVAHGLAERDLFHLGKYSAMLDVQFPFALGRTTLWPYRLIHFFSVVYLGSWFLPRDNHVWQRPYLRPIVTCGQHSLPIFSFSVALSYAIDLTHEAAHGGTVLLLALLLAGMGIMLFTGNMLSIRKRRHRETSQPSPALATETSNP